MKKKKSIRDVASELNVSITTLSFVLNGIGKEKRISAKVIEKIENYIRETGYKADFIGKSLRTGKSKTIGLIVGDLANPFFSEISSGIEKQAIKAGYSLIVASSNNDVKQMKNAINLLMDRKVDGLIIAPTVDIEKEISDLLEKKVPLVLYDRYFEELNSFNVKVNNTEGVFMATRHLHENGFNKIAFITLDLNQNSFQERQKGYTDYLESKGLEKKIFVVPYQMDYEKISDQILTFVNDNLDVDAMVFSTNILTIGALLALKNLDIDRPKIGIVSFDDHLLYKVFTPTITAIKQPINRIVDTIMVNLLRKLNQAKNSTFVNETITLPVDLVIRQSSEKES